MPLCTCCLSPVDSYSDDSFTPECRHVLHLSCLEKWISHQTCREKTCPTCRASFDKHIVLVVKPDVSVQDAERSLEHVNVTGDVCWHINDMQMMRAVIRALTGLFERKWTWTPAAVNALMK